MATKIGIIGGSGLDNPDILQHPKDQIAATPYGEPSSPLRTGTIGGVSVVLLARHGRLEQAAAPPPGAAEAPVNSPDDATLSLD